MSTPSLKLKGTGLEIPQFGLGTWLAEPGVVGQSVRTSILDLNYTHIDCASIYQNEKEIGDQLSEIFKSGKKQRKDIFVTSKLWNDMHSYDDVIEGCKKSLSDLQCDYLDLYLIHFPVSFNKGCLEAEKRTDMKFVPLEETWRGMEKCVELGLVKNIGVSNMNIFEMELISNYAKIPISVNQLELQPYYQRQDIVKYCKREGIQVVAHTSLGGSANPWAHVHQGKLLDDKVINQIAKDINKSAAQVLLKWSVQKGLAVIPKSLNKDRLKQNSQLFDFELSEKQLLQIDALDKGDSGKFNHPITCWLGRSKYKDDPENGDVIQKKQKL